MCSWFPYIAICTWNHTFGTNSHNKYPAKQPQRQQDGQGVIPSFARHSSDGKGAEGVLWCPLNHIYTLLQDFIKQRPRSLIPAF